MYTQSESLGSEGLCVERYGEQPGHLPCFLGRHSAPHGHTLSGERKTQHTGVFQTSGEAAPYPLLLTTSTRVGKSRFTVHVEKDMEVMIITIAHSCKPTFAHPCVCIWWLTTVEIVLLRHFPKFVIDIVKDL